MTLVRTEATADGADSAVAHALDASPVAPRLSVYQRVARIVSYLFVAAVAAVNVISSPTNVGVYVLLAVAIVLLVFFHDVLPAERLSGWRLRTEGIAIVAFLTALLTLTGGHASPFFFGFTLLVGGWSLWATGAGVFLLTLVAVAAYLAAVVVASAPATLSPESIARVAFNVVALFLVAYVAWVIGREQRRAQNEALKLSRYDALTGLYSRTFFISTAEREIPRSTRTGRPFALLMFDLDGLKAANDRFGHNSGDQLLRGVADVLRGDVRAADVAGRYAGDEFVVLLPETDLVGALRVADKIRGDISRLTIPHRGTLIRTTVSIGVATFPDDGRTWGELIGRADMAMYEAKRRGRDQIVHYAREPLPGGDQAMYGGEPWQPPGADQRISAMRPVGPGRPVGVDGHAPTGQAPPDDVSAAADSSSAQGLAPWETRRG